MRKTPNVSEDLQDPVISDIFDPVEPVEATQTESDELSVEQLLKQVSIKVKMPEDLVATVL